MPDQTPLISVLFFLITVVIITTFTTINDFLILGIGTVLAAVAIILYSRFDWWR